jgi:SAM-dependent methyltransferase
MQVTFNGQVIDLGELVRDIMRPDRTPHYDPWFERYHKWLGEDWKLGNYMRYLRTLLDQGQINLDGLTVLDAGCGFGLTALFLNLLGAAEVHGLDCHEGMIRTFETYLSYLPYALRTYPRLGDVANLPYADDSFDLVLSIEAISHYRETEAFLREARRVLRPGGTLIIVDGNNSRRPATVRVTREIWNAFENGPATEDIHGHRVDKPFVEMRREMLADAFPNLTPRELDQLSRRTFGLWGDDVLAAGRAYADKGELPDSMWDGVTCPIDPIQGYFIEYLLDPIELGRTLRRMGFKPTVRAYFGGARGGLVHLANDLLTQPAFTPLALRFTPSFRILARNVEHGS